jgi:hypothetical protein
MASRGPVSKSNGNLRGDRELGRGLGQVLDVNRPGVHDGSAGHPAAVNRIREPSALIHGAVQSGHLELIPLDEQESGVRRLTQPAGALNQRIEDRLQIRR